MGSRDEVVAVPRRTHRARRPSPRRRFDDIPLLDDDRSLDEWLAAVTCA